MAKELYKTTIVIWSEFDGSTVEIDRLAQEAMSGSAYCSKQESRLLSGEELENDEDWDETDFFDNPNEEDDETNPIEDDSLL